MVYDELDLPWGTLRIRPKGSAAGHKGMKSVIAQLGHQRILRGSALGSRIPAANAVDGAKFVLAPFKRAQKQEVEEMVVRAERRPSNP